MEVTDIITKLAWPIVFLVVFFTLKKEIISLFPRFKRLKLFGQEFELDKEIDKLEDKVKESKEEGIGLNKSNNDDGTIQHVLDTASREPKVGFLLLATEIEKEIRNLFAISGLLAGKNYVGPKQALSLLVEKGYLHQNTLSSLEIFRDLRNKIVHGHDEEDKEKIIRVLDIGLTLFKVLKAMPHETNIVYAPDVDIYSDSECKHMINDAKGLIMETISPGGAEKLFRIFPTTKIGYYKKGEQIAWEWSFGKVWNDTWYKDVKTKKIKQAWNSSAEFIGRHLDEI